MLLNSILIRLASNCDSNSENLDPMDYPISEMGRDTLWNCVLMATNWSFGAVLNKELRKTYDDLFSEFAFKFNINFSSKLHGFKPTLFDVFFDVERLEWGLLVEKLEYKLKIHYDQNMNALVLPTQGLSQAYFVQDHLMHAMQADRELNKHLRLIGPSSSSKTTILNTFAKQMNVGLTQVSVPMSSYLTLERLQ